MSSRRSTQSLLFPLLLVFVGVMFLLTNLGVVERSIWSEVLRYWPVILILMGVDALVRHASMRAAFGTFLGVAALLIAGLVLLEVFAPESWGTREQSFSHPVSNAASARITLACQGCTMDVRKQPPTSQPDTLISGVLSLRRGEKLTQTVRRDGSQASFTLESHHLLASFLGTTQRTTSWRIALNEAIPVSLTLTTDRAVDIDFTGIALQSADISTGSQTSTILLPSAANASLYLSGSHIQVLVPTDVGLRISRSEQSEVTVPSSYVWTGNDARSPNYDDASFRTDIIVRPGSDWVELVAAD